jgi:hypothetical protein
MENNYSGHRGILIWILIILIAIGVMYATKNFNLLNKDTKIISKQFEYQIKYLQDINCETELNQLGGQGWQVVGSRRATANVTLGAKSDYGYEFILMKEK